MYLIKNISIIISLSLLINLSCQSQVNEHKTTEAETVTHKEVKKVYNPKDLKIISEFIDTLRLYHYQYQIENFRKDDSLHPNRKTDIVFSGSSSIRKWESLSDDFSEYKVLNRGFGGSSVPEAIYFFDVLFLKHKPEKIVFYSGDNDVAFLRSSTDKIIKSYKYLFNIFNSELPNTKIYILSVKPSPARWKFWPQMQEINKQLKSLCDTNLYIYIDVSSCLLDTSGKPKKELFTKDGVHMNKKGYELWAKIILDAIK
jgi:lysophospholipase L1-like esterase